MLEKPLPDLDAWIGFYRDARIPVLRHTVQELDQLRANAQHVNARVLSGIILRDPLMTLRVLAYIERHRKQRQTTDITTIERALMMIGIDPFFNEFQDLPLVEEQLKPHPRALLGLLKTVNRARRAAHWAHEWAFIRHDLDVDEITVATLLHDLGEIMMWCFAPSLALEVVARQTANRAMRSAILQTEVYGVALFELKLGLVRAWGLPPLLGMLMDHDKADNPRVRNVKLAVDLARHSANGWDDAAIPDDLKAIEALLHISRENLLRRIGADPEAIRQPAEDVAPPPDGANGPGA